MNVQIDHICGVQISISQIQIMQDANFCLTIWSNYWNIAEKPLLCAPVGTISISANPLSLLLTFPQFISDSLTAISLELLDQF